jgi:hypothetical protein
MDSKSQTPAQTTTATPSVIDIELLALDLTSCDRCRGTLTNIEVAIETLRPVLEVMGAQVLVRKLVIESEEQAHRHRFVTSPTIRVNGRDIAFETLESQCEACSDLCGCEEGTACRVWRYRGEEHTQAPVGLVVESVLHEVLGSRGESAAAPYPAVPENLRRFFGSKSARGPAGQSCCHPAEQETCCEPSHKAACCETSEPATCGCL